MIEVLEITATITGIIAVWLQARENIIAWPFAIVSVAILAYIFFDARLLSDFGLHVVYIVLNIYGWVIWQSRDSSSEVVSIVQMNGRLITISIATVMFGTLCVGYLMQKYTQADLTYFDAFTTSGSLVAQFLLAKKYLQNWLLWIIIDLVAIPMYLYKGLYFVAFLFFIYLIICTYGFVSWRRQIS